MKGFHSNIEKDTQENNNFRKVLYTGKHLQLVLMSLKAGEDIGAEIHEKNDQFFRFESGTGKCVIDEHAYEVKAGDVVLVPAGAKHNILNTDSSAELKMHTIYGPPNHQDKIVKSTKEEAESGEEEFDGKTSE